MTDKYDPRFDARFQPGFEQKPAPQQPRTPARDEPATEDAVPDASAPDNVAPDAGETTVDPPEPNPFERTLWVVAAVLVVGGVAVAFWANSLNYFGTGDAWNWKEILQSSGWALSSPMVTVGLATGVGLLFRRAIAWSPSE